MVCNKKPGYCRASLLNALLLDQRCGHGGQDIGRLIAAVAQCRPLANGFEIPIDQDFSITEHLDQLVLFTIYTINTVTVQSIGAYRLDALVSAH